MPEHELAPHPLLALSALGFDPLQALFAVQPLTEMVVPDTRPAMHRPAKIFFKLSVFTTSSLFDLKKKIPPGARIHEKNENRNETSTRLIYVEKEPGNIISFFKQIYQGITHVSTLIIGITAMAD